MIKYSDISSESSTILIICKNIEEQYHHFTHTEYGMKSSVIDVNILNSWIDNGKKGLNLSGKQQRIVTKYFNTWKQAFMHEGMIDFPGINNLTFEILAKEL
jgi:hypothetical protein